MAYHFVLACFGHATYLFIYIFLMHMDVLLWFYYVSLFSLMVWNANAYVMYYYTVCVFFRHDYA